MPLGVPHPGISLLGPRAPSVPHMLDPHHLPLSGVSLWDLPPAALRGTWVEKERAQKTSPCSGGGHLQTGALEPPSGNPETGFQEAAWWVVRAERQKSLRILPGGLPAGSAVKIPPAKAEDPGSVPGLGGPHMPGATKPTCRNYCKLCSATGGATAMRSPCTTRERLCSNQDPGQTRLINQFKIIKKNYPTRGSRKSVRSVK